VGPKLPQGWPRSGAIVFDQVVMKYAPHLPPALKGVSFDIKSSEKVGVVGRTGSGKSTLLLALYRMFNLESGSVTLDGLDISTITLNQLRNGLSVIPQEPVVFSGTVRSNLDPFGEKSHDGELWQALRECGLEEAVSGARRLCCSAAAMDGAGLAYVLRCGTLMLHCQHLVCWHHSVCVFSVCLLQQAAAQGRAPCVRQCCEQYHMSMPVFKPAADRPPPCRPAHRRRPAAALMASWTAPAAMPGPWASSS
jgi:hypothetical protein